MNIRGDTNYARYITIAAVVLLVAVVGVWLVRSMPAKDKNTDPRKGEVCMDTQCIVRKECDTTTLLIKTTVPANNEPIVQRVPNSNECQS